MGVSLSQDFPTEVNTIQCGSMPRVAFKPTIPSFESCKTVYATYLTASSLRAKQNNADHTCIWSCSPWVDGAVPDACQIIHAKRTNSGQSTGLHVADFFRGGCWLQGTPQRSVGHWSTSPCMWLILRHRSFNKATLWK